MKIWLVKQFLVLMFEHDLRSNEHFTTSECDAGAEYDDWKLNTERYRIRVHNERLWHCPKTIAHTNTSSQHSKHIEIISSPHRASHIHLVLHV